MVGRGGNSRNWLSPLFMLIRVSIMELAEMFNTNKSMINRIIRYKFKELWQGRK